MTCFATKSQVCEWLVAIQTGKQRGSPQNGRGPDCILTENLCNGRFTRSRNHVPYLAMESPVSDWWGLSLDPQRGWPYPRPVMVTSRELGEDPYEWRWVTGLTMACSMDSISTVSHNFWSPHPCRFLGKGRPTVSEWLGDVATWLCPRVSTVSVRFFVPQKPLEVSHYKSC